MEAQECKAWRPHYNETVCELLREDGQKKEERKFCDEVISSYLQQHSHSWVILKLHDGKHTTMPISRIAHSWLIAQKTLMEEVFGAFAWVNVLIHIAKLISVRTNSVVFAFSLPKVVDCTNETVRHCFLFVTSLLEYLEHWSDNKGGVVAADSNRAATSSFFFSNLYSCFLQPCLKQGLFPFCNKQPHAGKKTHETRKTPARTLSVWQ